MHSEILFMFCATFVLIETFPVQVYEYLNPATGDLEVFEIVDDPDYVDIEHKQVKKSILDPCVQSKNGDVRCFFQNEDRNAGYQESLKFSMLPYAEENFGFNDQNQWDYDDQRSDYDQSMQNFGISIEEYPFVDPSAINFNQGYPGPLSSYSTHIHGLVPSEDTAPMFNSNIYQSQNMLPLNQRMARRTSSYDEFLAQLAHDAMLNNILPTMPYVRSSAGYQVPYGPPQAMALYPRAGVQSCGQPILVGCSPSIYQGSLVPRAHPTGHQYFVQQIPLQYNNGHVISNHEQGHDKVKPPVILPNQDYRKAAAAGLVSGKKV